jgi:hypothetical protein
VHVEHFVEYREYERGLAPLSRRAAPLPHGRLEGQIIAAIPLLDESLTWHKYRGLIFKPD